MSTELPDFRSAPAWMDRRGRIWTRNFPKEVEVPLIEDCTPWTPLRTAADWKKQRDDLATAATELSERTLMTASESMAVLIAATDWIGAEKLTPTQWVQRIVRDKLAKVIDRTQEPGLSPALRRRIGESWAREIADAVIAALPDLMGDTTKEEA